MTPDEPKPDDEIGGPTWDRIRRARWAVRGFALVALVVLVIKATGEPSAYVSGIVCFVIAVLVTLWLSRRGKLKLTGRPQPPGVIFAITGLSLLMLNAPTVAQCAYLGALAGFLATGGFLGRSALGV